MFIQFSNQLPNDITHSDNIVYTVRSIKKKSSEAYLEWVEMGARMGKPTQLQ